MHAAGDRLPVRVYVRLFEDRDLLPGADEEGQLRGELHDPGCGAAGRCGFEGVDGDGVADRLVRDEPRWGFQLQLGRLPAWIPFEAGLDAVTPFLQHLVPEREVKDGAGRGDDDREVHLPQLDRVDVHPPGEPGRDDAECE
ncbi:hypothetical protein [Agromyces humi]|uniref:hypothetical protein n=1 Tax=Agromyces humi TaxID=1766800 RepID=UPI00135AD7F8|nr:hypothetical protein [Agromyces humi]